jgi:hypothetical protein
MAIEQMTEDELAAFVRDTDTRVVRTNGLWWVEPKPFFFRPLIPLAEFDPTGVRYPVRSSVGGVQHCVPDEAAANSTKSYYVFEEPQKYDLATLSHGHPNKIRKGLKYFQWRRIDDVDQFIIQAHSVYVSFINRTGYSFRKERVNPRKFEAWARAVFKHPKIVLNGAFCGDRLSAVSICYLAGGIYNHDTYFSDTQSLPLRVFDFVIHKVREDAATTGARLVYMGPQTGVVGIDRAKEGRGCNLIVRRTHLRLNPFASFALKWSQPNVYSKLWGRDSASISVGASVA